MRRKEVLRLMAGFRRFREKYFQEKSIYEKLSSGGQSPKTLFIGCSDSRVDPAIITSASPGELFVIRNVANLVPPCEMGQGLHGVSSAIEFAVVNLKVENILILGHRQCGGIRSLMTEQSAPNSFVGRWMQIAQSAKERVQLKYANEPVEAQIRHCEMESIVNSIQNLRTFPFIQEAIEKRDLQVIGVYFDLELGQMHELTESMEFRLIDI